MCSIRYEPNNLYGMAKQTNKFKWFVLFGYGHKMCSHVEVISVWSHTDGQATIVEKKNTHTYTRAC